MHNDQKHLVIGLGEIGLAIQRILKCDGYDMSMIDVPPKWLKDHDVVHICFPYSAGFEEEVARYQTETGASMTIIHSTVPVGTSSRLSAVHSPVRGKHPDLEKSIRTFVKYFGGPRAIEAAGFFTDKGLTVYCTSKAETTEALKIFDTELYHLNILAEKAIHAFCDENDLPFSTVYTDANRSYNEGYAAMGMPQFSKYVLEHVPGPIGGHCVVSNSKMIELFGLIQKLDVNK